MDNKTITKFFLYINFNLPISSHLFSVFRSSISSSSSQIPKLGIFIIRFGSDERHFWLWQLMLFSSKMQQNFLFLDVFLVSVVENDRSAFPDLIADAVFWELAPVMYVFSIALSLLQNNCPTLGSWKETEPEGCSCATFVRKLYSLILNIVTISKNLTTGTEESTHKKLKKWRTWSVNEKFWTFHD